MTQVRTLKKSLPKIRRRASWRTIAALSAGLVAVVCGPVNAGEGDTQPVPPPVPLFVELNAVAPRGDGCRLSFLIRNRANVLVRSLSLEVVLFDADGRAGQFLVLEAGRLPAGKSRVRQYDIGGTPCAGIGRILVNDVAACTGEGLGPARCADGLTTATRTSIPLDY